MSGSTKIRVGPMRRGDTPEEWLRHRAISSPKASLSTVKPEVRFFLKSNYLAKTYFFAGVYSSALNRAL